jgi:hypothetical protein
MHISSCRGAQLSTGTTVLTEALRVSQPERHNGWLDGC